MVLIYAPWVTNSQLLCFIYRNFLFSILHQVLALVHLSLPNISVSFTFCRESTPIDKIREAHRRVMVANHPDAGGSHYLASKVNEAKDIMVGKTKGTGSAF